MIRRIKEVSRKRRKFIVKNFKSVCSLPINVIAHQDCVKDGLGKEQIQVVLPDADAIDFFVVNNCLYVQCDDGNLYFCNDAGASVIKNVGTNKFYAYPINQSGKKKTLFLSGDSAFTEDGKNVSNLPEIKMATFHNGRYFFSDKTSVYYTKIYDFAKNSTSLSLDGKIWFDENSGCILGLFNDDEGVYVFCEHAAYVLSAASNGLDFKLDKLKLSCTGVLDGTFASNGEDCAFISGGKLTLFKNGKMTGKEGVLDGKSFALKGEPTIECGKYYLPIQFLSQNFIYVYDFAKDAESLYEIPDASVSKGQYFIGDAALNRISDGVQTESERKFLILELDFSDCKIKTLCGVNLYAQSESVLSISGDFGEKSYSLSKGYNALLLNLKSRSFALEFTASQPFGLQNLTLEYILKGE